MVSEKRLMDVKKISLIGYMRDIHPTLCNEREDGTLSLKYEGHTMVIYDNEEPHSYTFGTVKKPYKDNIGTIRALFGYGFEEAVERLEEYASSSRCDDKTEISLHLFDDLKTSSLNTDTDLIKSFLDNQ